MNTHTHQFIKSLFITITLTGTLLGCASAGIKSSSGQQVYDVMPTFANGDARLTCQVSCSGAWGASRRKAKGFYENELWNDLVQQVTSIGYQTDLTYFYLGRAAEGLGHTKAARVYYKLALSKIHKCAGFINNCDGFNFPDEIYSRLRPLDAEVAREAAADKAAADKAAAEKAAAEKAAAEKAAAEKAAAEKAAAEKAAAEKGTRETNKKLAKKNTKKLAATSTINSTANVTELNNSVQNVTELNNFETPATEQPNTVTTNSGDGPFGLSWGNTVSQVKNRGVNIIKTNSLGNLSSYKTTSLPKSVSFGESYTLIFHPNQGLQKVIVVSKNINNDVTGREGKELYENVKSQLTTKYGSTPKSTEITGLKLWKEYDEFYQCLKYSGCGIWVSLWESPNVIALELKGLSRGTGFLNLVYEGPAWSKIVDENKNQSSKEDASAL